MSLFLPLIYFIIITALLIRHGTWFSPDQIFAVGFLAALFLGRSKRFIRDWSVPVVLLLSYDYLRGLVPKLTEAVNIYPMINFDKLIFGALPTNTLQALFYTQGKIAWYDYAGTVLYMSHFIAPMLFGFIFWMKDKRLFKNYFLGLLILSYTAFFTYIIFPAMPPWMAAQKGIIPGVFKVMDQVFASFAKPIDLPSVYKFVGVNLVAAVPSLHAAYPFLTFLFLIRRYGVKSLFIVPYVLGVWAAIVYMGEHYIFDIAVGVLYAGGAFTLILSRNSLWLAVKQFIVVCRARYKLQ